MTPPLASDQGIDGPTETATAVLHSARPAIITITQRRDFVRASQARRMGTGSFLLQARMRGDGTDDIRVGFTASKKIGNAVARNRAKRRMRAVMREVLSLGARAGWDYVLVAKPEATITRDYCDLRADLTRALAQVHAADRPAKAATGNTAAPANLAAPA